MLRAPMRKLPRDSGQAMPLAAVGIFVMVLGILATLNLGQAVHQKIKLQNTADAAAYTLAAMEARTFNYIAFLNRAQIAHYNTAMVVQSYMTWVGFQVALFGTGADLVQTLYDSADMGEMMSTPCPYGVKCLWTALKAVIKIASTVYSKLRDAAVKIYKAGEKIGHWIIEAMAIFSRDVVWQTQLARAAVLNVHILSGMQNYIEKYDKDISFTSGKSVFLNVFVNAALNSLEYYQTFTNASGANPYIYGLVKDAMIDRRPWQAYPKRDDDPAKDAFRIMAELCNASRSPRFVSDRSGTAMAFLTPGTGFLTIIGSKMGQTKFTEEGTMNNAEVTPIGNEGNYKIGAYLSSDDFLQSGMGSGMATMGVTASVMYSPQGRKIGDAIAAYETDGKHYRYTGGTSDRQVIAIPPPTSPTGPKFETDNHSPWPGFAPYFMFKAKGDRTADFNQPSTWIFLNKHHKDFQTDDGSHAQNTRAPWYSKFSWQNGPQVASLDTTIGGSRNSYLFEGLNVLSRGMAYYHRRGNWREHPSFFNPYWRARLAPVGQKLQAFWDRWVTQKITTSSENQVAQLAVNFLRNAQMDMMTAFITALITH